MFQVVAVVQEQVGEITEMAQHFESLAGHDQCTVFPAFIYKALPQGVPGGFSLAADLPLDNLEGFAVHVRGVRQAHHAAHTQSGTKSALATQAGSGSVACGIPVAGNGAAPVVGAGAAIFERQAARTAMAVPALANRGKSRRVGLVILNFPELC